MVKVDKDYVFDGPDGELGLVDMFDGRTQLYVHHFMWIDADDRGCPSCTAAADLTFTERDRALLNARDVTFACVSRAPYASIARYRDEHGWTFPWYSSRDGDFTYDYHVTLDPARAPVEYNYKSTRRTARRRLDRRRPAWRLAGGQRLPPARRRGVPHLLGVRARPRPHRRSAIRSWTSPRTAGRRAGRTRPAGWPRDSVAAGVHCSSDHAERKAGRARTVLASSWPTRVWLNG